ncbi:IS66 family transposase [Sorangium sp. So ce1099]|uniref:IS66 family transposase n=1 Tax=Sorangium sp. So ce1099 TaxID=3133331 RepID=UPI003F63AEB0
MDVLLARRVCGASTLQDGHLRCAELLTITQHARCEGLEYYRGWAVIHGFRIGRGNMTRWQYDCGGIAMRIADAIWSDALSRSWFAMDATGTAIRAKEKHRYGHVFVLVAPGDGVLFRYTPTYDGPTVAKLFGGYQGTLVADASANHNVLFGPGKAREAGCWSHARRRFFKAFKAGAGKEAAFALQAIQALFRVEEECALCSPDERLEIRQRESAPLIEKLFAWGGAAAGRPGAFAVARRTGLFAQPEGGALRVPLQWGDPHPQQCQ